MMMGLLLTVKGLFLLEPSWAKRSELSPPITPKITPKIASEFKLALPGYVYQFPRDHASHPAFKTEWWYYTGHLKSGSGKRYGYELTFFRIGQPRKNLPKNSAFRLENSILTHFALTDESDQKFYFDHKLNRAGFNAEASSDHYAVRNENWSVHQNRKHQHVLKVKSGRYRLNLTLTPQKPPTIHGQNGISQKANCMGCASHYYSLTRIQTVGTLQTDHHSEPVSGLSWMDHEFGSNQLSPEQVGWDWFSIQLSDQSELMLYVMRRKDGSPDVHSSGSVIDRLGHVLHLSQNEFKITPLGNWTSPNSGGKYPMGWQIQVPSQKLRLTLSPTLKTQELYFPRTQGLTYWEGSVSVRGHREKTVVTGQGYVEMTGYAHRFHGRI
jgi:predicted secreted hydrolase